MEILIVGWFLCGLLGSYLTLEFLFRRSGVGIDIRLLVMCAFLAVLAGPINLVVGVMFTASYFIRKLPIDWNREVFPAHRPSRHSHD